MNQIELYESADGSVSLSVRNDGTTVWLSLDQMAALFGRDKSTISRHLSGVFRDEELDREAVVADFATTAADGKTYQVAHYALDVVISVGYRVKSVEGVRFRRWSTDVLRRYLLDGVAVNERRLQEIGKIITILGRSPDEVVAGVADALTAYLPGLELLRDYDQGHVDAEPKVVPGWTLTLEEARGVVARVGEGFPADTLFGRERGDVLAGIVATIYQGFGGQDLYPTVEEKAANLLSGRVTRSAAPAM